MTHSGLEATRTEKHVLRSKLGERSARNVVPDSEGDIVGTNLTTLNMGHAIEKSRLAALLVCGTGMYQEASRKEVKQPFENEVGRNWVTLEVFTGYGVHLQMYHRIDPVGQELMMSGDEYFLLPGGNMIWLMTRIVSRL